ncbi:MAG: bifunctional DNA primase/polymerase [Ignavibacteriales bacterium]|nr:bifunctional DNA primase/polymerase [Ignavibacterium sp.]MCZ2268098.1 bifunctional DNA primase/polymerase [Ignavibacteriales bacterium]
MNFRETAKDYYDVYGFNLLPLENKVPRSNWEHWQTNEMEMSDIDQLGWNASTNGIGAISGIKNLRCLDFDVVSDYEIVKLFVKKLGLPLEYLWVVKSGSGKGYHIWFYCDSDSYLFDFLGGKKSYYKLILKEKGQCDHIELRWQNCQTVLPPSFHPSGGQYEFVNLRDKGIPASAPHNIGVGKLIDVLREFCVFEDETRDERRKKLEARGKSSRREIKYLKEAAEFIKGKIDNYDDFLRIGWALCSLCEAGKEYFLLIGADNPKYPEDTEAALTKKYNSLLKDYRGDITLGTFFEIAKKYGYEFPKMRFWQIEDGKANIIRNTFIEYLESEGFGKMFLGKDYIFIQEKENIVREVTPVNIKDFVFEYVNEFTDPGLKRIVKESLIRSAKTLFSEATLECLQTVVLKFAEDTKEQALFFFINCFIEVTRENVKIKKYSELNGKIWEKQLIKRDFSITKEGTSFEKFINNVCRNDVSRINALRSAIGYLMHGYKDPTRTKAIIFTDEKLSDKAFGRSGKGLVANAAKQMKNVLRIDGKNFRFDKSFPFQSVNPDTQIMFFDDVNKKFGFEKLFSIITEGITIEKKNKNEYSIPYERSPKILITTNQSITGSDDSSRARQFVVEFSDFYNANHFPIQDFGKMFFDEWDKNEWSAFDNYMIECCQYYLKNGLKEYDYVNLTKKKLIDETAVEFEEFIKDVPLNVEQNKKDLFERFKKEYEDFGQMKQNTFSKWTKVYAELYDLRIDERKSGADRYFTFSRKDEKAGEVGQKDLLSTETDEQFVL